MVVLYCKESGSNNRGPWAFNFVEVGMRAMCDFPDDHLKTTDSVWFVPGTYDFSV